MEEKKEKKKKPNRLRNIRMDFRVTKNEKEKIKKNASCFDLNLSDFVREKCVNGVIIKREITWIPELNKIGERINQIAKKVNEKGFLDENEFDKLKEEYENLFELLLKDRLQKT